MAQTQVRYDYWELTTYFIYQTQVAQVHPAIQAHREVQVNMVKMENLAKQVCG